MSDLEYYFDKDYILQRGQSDAEGYVKSKFQALLMISIYREDVFNTIWNNQSLREDIWKPTQYPSLSQSQAKNLFQAKVSVINDPFYDFINVK